MSINTPTISWEAIVSNTTVHLTDDYTYNCTLTPVNINDPGYGILAVGYYIVDNVGHIFEIKAVDGYDVEVYDLIENTQFEGPYNDKNTYVYESLYEAALLVQAKLNRLDESAEDFVRSLGLSDKNTYLGLLDTTDNTYVDQAGKIPQVNDDENALEFLDITTDWLSQYALLAGRTGDVLKIDQINEHTTGVGVTIESALIIDGRGYDFDSTAPVLDKQWANKKYVDDSSASSSLTTKGDIWTYDTGDVRLPVGTDRQLLLADSRETTGLKWVDELIKTDLIQKEIPVSDNTTSLWLSNPKGVYYNGNTYIVYIDFDDNARKIAKYNHSTSTWTSATWTQTAFATGSNLDAADYAHCTPSVFIDSSGYINISYTSYKNDDVFFVRSTSIEDISAFGSEITVLSSTYSTSAAYPTILEIGSTLIIFHRGWTGSGYCLRRSISTDNGATWGNDIQLNTYYPYYQVRKDSNDRVHLAWHYKATYNQDLYYVYSDDAEIASPTWYDGTDTAVSIPFGLTDAKVFDSTTNWDSSYIIGLIPDGSDKIHLFTYVKDAVNTDKILHFEYSSSAWNEHTVVEENLNSWTVGLIQADVIYKNNNIYVLTEYISDPTFSTYGKSELKEYVSYNEGESWLFNQYVTVDSNDTTANPFYIRESNNIGWFEGDNDYSIGKSIQIGFPKYGDMYLTKDNGGSGSTTFIALTDTPSPYVANKYLQVNSGATALEFVDAPVSFGISSQIPVMNSAGDDFDYSADFTWDGDTLNVNGAIVQAIGTIGTIDTTPDVTGANIWKWDDGGTGLTLTNLDNAEIGAIYILYNVSTTYGLEIADSGNFNLSAAWNGHTNDSITLLCIASSTFIEITRSNN